MTTNIVNALFGAQREATTRALHQYDYGQRLIFADLQLPQAYEVHFGNDPYEGETVTQIGDSTGVVIPDECLLTAGYTYAWVFLHTGEDDGETRYLAKIQVTARSKPTNQEPTPVQQDAITEAIAALDRAVEQTAADVILADGYATDARNSATSAKESATEAAQSATEAREYAEAAAQSASDSEHFSDLSEGHAQASAASAADSSASAATSAEKASEASQSADRAEQAATTAGYMWIEIVDGHLVYTRTDQVDADFSLSSTGHLILESVA